MLRTSADVLFLPTGVCVPLQNNFGLFEARMNMLHPGAHRHLSCEIVLEFLSMTPKYSILVVA